MIVTKSWLNDWVDLSDISTEELAKTFNSIGLEVDRVENFRVPAKIVLAKVLECEKHPDADKLNICQVDIGTSVRQIVCGASNVRAGIYVACATIGAEMPGGLVIKPVKLRGVDSEGMICSSTELGLPKLEDGIMVLDESIGELKLGQELSQNPILSDDLIELELTANRGDCLSIRGVARDLCAAYNKNIRNDIKEGEERRVGIGRILQLSHVNSENVRLEYRAIDLKEVVIPFIQRLRLAQVEEEKSTDLETLLFYSTYSTGVILRAYDYNFFTKADEAKVHVEFGLDSNSMNEIRGKSRASLVGIIQDDESRVNYDEGTAIIEASYIKPDVISMQMSEKKLDNGPHYYRTSRGSEPELALGLNLFSALLSKYSDSSIYGGSISCGESAADKVVSISSEEINAIIGIEVENTKVTQLLQNLGFSVEKRRDNYFTVGVPEFRHDIENKQDIVEEIVRLIGIDNIKSKPFILAEANRISGDYSNYLKRRTYRERSASNGFHESIHFVFNEKKSLQKYGFDATYENLELLNPIVNTLDTLRSTQYLSLLESASKNAKVGRKSIALFEIGSVFDKERHESMKLSLIFSGDKESESISNAGKADSIDFATFTQKISDIVGDIELRSASTTHTLSHPYQSAKILQNSVVIGEVFKLHPSVQKEYDLDTTYLCEIDFELLKYELDTASEYSKFQASYKDLSLVVPKEQEYLTIKEIIEANRPQTLVRFYPVDRYSDEALGDKVSLSIRFVLQSLEKTLEEEDITSAMSQITDSLESELGLNLR